MNYRIKYLILPLIFLLAFIDPAKSQSLPVNMESLLMIQQELRQQKRDTEKALAKIRRKKSFSSMIDQMKRQGFKLDGVENGRPVFTGHHNAGSFSSLGGEAATPAGFLGLNLTGANISAIIWDSGISRITHQELVGRITRRDVGAEDDHATHVAGTLIASGVDGDARGYLPGASIRTFDFTDDTNEIVNELMNTVVHLSNHSYGFVLGWSSGMWLGDDSISDQEDYRFGYYSQNARTMDDILFNAPYYTIVKSAGNDRGDAGDGTFPPDGPYDSVGDFAVSKNVLAIGAVEKLSAPYAGPADVIMSSFSGWGPTDDGRIKPDFVAPGVQIYSSANGSDTDYASLQGTSQASPAGAGAVGLVNEANFLLTGNYLKAATLRAILVATAHEAGDGDGPDYEFGWGLISIENALNHIVGADNVNRYIIEETLTDGQEYVVELNPLANEKITVSLAWTDPAGTPVSASLDPTDRMLVNDLDLRLEDESGNIVMPWILDPTRPMNIATRGDNVLDNAEKIEFDNPLPRKYFVKVSHKGTLTNDAQDFSLIIDNTSQDPGIENFYWVQNDGFLEAGTNWSNASGGSVSSSAPDVNSKLIFDDNSDANGTDIDISLNSDLTINSLLLLSDKNVTIDLQGNALIVNNDILINGENTSIINGRLILENTDPGAEKSLQLDQLAGSGLTIVLGDQNLAQWTIKNSTFSADSLSTGSGTLVLKNSTITLSHALVFNDPIIDDGTSTIIFNGSGANAKLNSNTNILSEIIARKSLDLQSASTVNQMTLESGDINVIGAAISIIDLSSSNSQIQINPGFTLTIVNDWMVNNSMGFVQNITSSDSGNPAFFHIENHIKRCFENFNIANVNLTGNASVGVGTNSIVQNSNNWISKVCGDILFANFTTLNECAKGLSTFTNSSEGTFTTTTWSIDGETISTENDASHTFPIEGIYAVKLEISDGAADMTSWTQMITVDTARLDSNYIVTNATQLVSFRSAPSYQWYQNDMALIGESSRLLDFTTLSGTYFVVTSDGVCNRKSAILDTTTSINGPELFSQSGLVIQPNPVIDRINIFNQGDELKVKRLTLSNTIGQIVLSKRRHNLPNGISTIDAKNYPPGVYILKLDTEQGLLSQKIILQ